MALGTPAVATPAVNGTSSAITTASFTVTSGSRIYVFAAEFDTGSDPGAASISDSQSLTWDSVASQPSGFGSNPRIRLQCWRATSNGNSMTVTVTPGTGTPIATNVHVISISGASTDITNTGFGTSGVGDPAPSLTSAPAASSAVLGIAAIWQSTGIAPPTNYTELDEQANASQSNARTETVYDHTSAAQSASWTDAANNNATALIVEVKEDSGVQTLTPSLVTNTQTFHAATVSATYALSPSLVTNTQSFFSPTVAHAGQTLQPSLVTNTQTFFGPTVTPGPVTLAPSLVTNAQSFFSPTVTPGAITITAPFLTNEQSFFALTVERGSVFVVDATLAAFTFNKDNRPSGFTFTPD